MVRSVVSFGSLGVSYPNSDDNARKNFEAKTRNLEEGVTIATRQNGIFEERIINGLPREKEEQLQKYFEKLGLNSQLNVKA